MNATAMPNQSAAPVQCLERLTLNCSTTHAEGPVITNSKLILGLYHSPEIVPEIIRQIRELVSATGANSLVVNLEMVCRNETAAYRKDWDKKISAIINGETMTSPAELTDPTIVEHVLFALHKEVRAGTISSVEFHQVDYCKDDRDLVQCKERLDSVRTEMGKILGSSWQDVREHFEAGALCEAYLEQCRKYFTLENSEYNVLREKLMSRQLVDNGFMSNTPGVANILLTGVNHTFGELRHLEADCRYALLDSEITNLTGLASSDWECLMRKNHEFVCNAIAGSRDALRIVAMAQMFESYLGQMIDWYRAKEPKLEPHPLLADNATYALSFCLAMLAEEDQPGLLTAMFSQDRAPDDTTVWAKIHSDISNWLDKRVMYIGKMKEFPEQLVKAVEKFRGSWDGK